MKPRYRIVWGDWPLHYFDDFGPIFHDYFRFDTYTIFEYKR